VGRRDDVKILKNYKDRQDKTSVSNPTYDERWDKVMRTLKYIKYTIENNEKGLGNDKQ
jgi:hypothetical protein